MNIIQRPSPNFNARRNGHKPKLIVLHFTGMADCESAAEWLCSPEREVSSHYLIAESGQIYQLVDEENRAWHAGAGSWRGVDDINSQSIGIELDNNGAQPFTRAQIDALLPLLEGIMARWDIRPDNVIGHSDMAPARKFDPGPYFPWSRLEAEDIAAQNIDFIEDIYTLSDEELVERAHLAGYTGANVANDLRRALALRYAQNLGAFLREI